MRKMLFLMLFLSVLFSQAHLEAADYKPGFCPITGNQIIDNFGRPLPNYKLIYFEMSNGSEMIVCVDKDAVITEADFPKIMDYVKQGWQWEINRKKWTPKQIQNYKDNFFNLTIVKRVKE